MRCNCQSCTHRKVDVYDATQLGLLNGNPDAESVSCNIADEFTPDELEWMKTGPCPRWEPKDPQVRTCGNCDHSCLELYDPSVSGVSSDGFMEDWSCTIENQMTKEETALAAEGRCPRWIPIEDDDDE